MSQIRKIAPLGSSGQWKTFDPFLFVAHHLDNYPAGNDKMEAPRRGNGSDFNPSAPYRMYHGDKIPGFPQHPHRGFETLTATLEGIIDHSDSLGTAGRYGGGDLQWMTAGKGIVHGENMPLVHTDKPNPLHLFQIWLNLPKAKKFVDPTFVMHWREEIPRVQLPGAEVIVWAGELFGSKGLAPPRDSYAAEAGSEVAVWHLSLQAGATLELPPASSSEVGRTLYFYDGSSLSVGGQQVTVQQLLQVDAGAALTLSNPGPAVAQILVLQGRPLGEPVAQHGPFVMNSQQEIVQAFSDYQRTQFGGWPWPQDAMVFGRTKGRFALVGGKEHYPPGASAQTTIDS